MPAIRSSFNGSDAKITDKPLAEEKEFIRSSELGKSEEPFIIEIQDESVIRSPGNPKLQNLISLYQEIFKEELVDLPPERDFDHKIEFEAGVKSICLPNYRMSPKELDSLRSQLDGLLEKGFIVSSKSLWGFPILFAKKYGSLRLCVDYRGLNKITKKNRLTPPRIDELFDCLAEAKYFSRLDLSSGYYQIRGSPEDGEKTASRTRHGHYQFVVMPFGLGNAPATFQALMNSVFSEFVDESVLVYLDDILIYSKTEGEHLRHFETVLKKLQEHKLFAKLSKCRFFCQKLSFLGH